LNAAAENPAKAGFFVVCALLVRHPLRAASTVSAFTSKA
jgi:hypothetical protein